MSSENRNYRVVNRFGKKIERIMKGKSIRDAAIMLRWVLTHYSTATIDNMFAWTDSLEREVTSADIAKEYFKHNK